MCSALTNRLPISRFDLVRSLNTTPCSTDNLVLLYSTVIFGELLVTNINILKEAKQCRVHESLASVSSSVFYIGVVGASGCICNYAVCVGGYGRYERLCFIDSVCARLLDKSNIFLAQVIRLKYGISTNFSFDKKTSSIYLL